MTTFNRTSSRIFRTLGVSVALAAGITACDFGRQERSETGGEVDKSFAPTKVEAVKGVRVAEINEAIGERLEGARPKWVTASVWGHATKLYEMFDGYPIWLDHDGLRERRTKTLMTALLAADADALSLDNYPLTELHRVLSELLEVKRPSAKLLADVDVVLTATYAALGEDLLMGQVDPSTVSQDWHIKPTPAQIDSALGRFLGDRDFDVSMTQMRPEYPEYKALQEHLVRYREIIAQGGWQPVPDGKALKPGERASAARLAALRERLRAEGYLKGDGPADTTGQAEYDRELAGAVAQFQREHGIVVDSALGKQTLQSLNVPATYRLGQIAANMERFRWMPRTLGDRYVFVNVPAFRLEAYDDARKVMEMKVIVGAEFEDRNTPVFSDSMQYVVFRPYWNATDNIMEKELWPKVESDPTFLERSNYEIVTEKNGKQRIRQRPGDGNALGFVKFMFPNTFDIYMHDTPEQGLFAKDIRAFSHGCIRLEKPDELAQWVLGWTPQQVQEAMHGTRDDWRVDLKEKVPVFIVYFTTFVRDGRLYFGNDLYNRDAALVERVKNGAQPTVEAVKAVKVLHELAED